MTQSKQSTIRNTIILHEKEQKRTKHLCVKRLPIRLGLVSKRDNPLEAEKIWTAAGIRTRALTLRVTGNSRQQP